MGRLVVGAKSIKEREVHKVMGNAIPPAANDKTIFSIKSCRIRRKRPAPKENRMHISFRRERPRKIKRFATLEHASSNITPATAIKIDRKSTRLNSSHLVISYAVF